MVTLRTAIVACIAFVLAGVITSSISEKIYCNASTGGMTIPHRWKFIGGCQVKTRDGWVPLKNYRAI